MASLARRLNRDEAEAIGIAALAALAADPERLSRFLAMTGIGPENLRIAAREPGFLAGVLDHLAADEGALLAFAANHGIAPERVQAAHLALAGPAFERDVP